MEKAQLELDFNNQENKKEFDSKGRDRKKIIEECKIGPEAQDKLLFCKGEWFMGLQKAEDWKKDMDKLFDDSDERYK
jgi:hypothetical protein